MPEYTKEIYPLEKKSENEVQQYGFIILIDGKKLIKQWHKPKVMGIVFMTEDEATHEADEMINSFVNRANLPPLISPSDSPVLINYDESKQFEPVTIGIPIKEEPEVLRRTLRSLNNVIFSEKQLELITLTDKPQDYSLLTNFNVNEIIRSCTEPEARNIIIDNINTRYCIMVDSDSILDITAFNILRQLMEDYKNDDVGSISLNEDVFDGTDPKYLANPGGLIIFNGHHNALGCTIMDVGILKSLIKKTNRKIWFETQSSCTCIQLQQFLRDNGYKSGLTSLGTVLNTRGQV